MDEKKITVDQHLKSSEVAAILRQLADELEGKPSGVKKAGGWRLHDFNKLKLKLIREEGGQLAVRLKIKAGEERVVAPPDCRSTDLAEREYRPFKNRLKAIFAELTTLAKEGGLPTEPLADNFLAQARRLISFPGFGDPYYQEFWQACQGLRERVAARDPAGFSAQVGRIADLVRRCHREFK